MLAGSARSGFVEELDPSFRARLKRFFRIRTRSECDAEDLVQDTFVRLIQQQHACEREVSDAYVFTVAENLLRDRARRARVRGQTVSFHGDRTEQLLDIPCEEPSAERVLLGKDEVSRVMDALGELTVQTRSIFILCRIEGMPQRAVACQLGISVSAVEKHVMKALHHLVKRIEHGR